MPIYSSHFAKINRYIQHISCHTYRKYPDISVFLRIVLIKWCLSNQFDIKDIIYQARKTKLSDIRNSSTGLNNSVKPYLGNTIGTTKTTTTTTTPPAKATSTIKITAPTTAILGQHSNSEDVPVSPECNKTTSNVTYESDKSQNYANTTIFVNHTDSEELLNNNNGSVSLNVFAGSNEILIDIYFCECKKINDIDIKKYRLSCDGKICTKQIPHLHCILCNEEDFQTEHFLKRHLKQAHFNKAHCVKFENNACLSCRNKNHTMSKLKRKISHFHCPICKKTVRQKGNFQKHLSIHTDKITKNTNFNVNAISNMEHQTDIKSLKEHSQNLKK